MSDNSRKLRIEPHGDGRFAVWYGDTWVLVGSRREVEAAFNDMQAALDAGRSPSFSMASVARWEIVALRAELEELRNPVRSEPRDPPPSSEELIAAYQNAEAAGCDNRTTQDAHVQNIYGPLSRKTRETVRRAAGVGGKPGPKPKK
jgi:hypothetical protein